MTTHPEYLTFIYSLVDELSAHAERDRPRECCGILLGRWHGAQLAVHEAHVSLNVTACDPGRSYEIDARLHVRLQREARGRGLSIVGFYHSHPDGPAEPSDLDLERAWPGVAYVILAPTADHADRGAGRWSVRAWWYSDPVQGFKEVPLRFLPPGSPASMPAG